MERKEELFVLTVNGFTLKEVKNYVLLDMIIMIMIGSITGLICGSFLGSYVLNCFTSDTLLFMNKISITALTVSLIISTVISAIITRISLKDLNGLYQLQ